MDNSKKNSLNDYNKRKNNLNLTNIIHDFKYNNSDNNEIPNLIYYPYNYQGTLTLNNPKNNMNHKNSTVYHKNISKMSYNIPHEASNLSNKYSNEIQIRSNLQIKDLSKNNSINQANPTIEKLKNFQKIQKIKINYENPKPKDMNQAENLIHNALTNKAFFKSTNDDVLSSEQKENLTKDPSFKSNACQANSNANRILDTNHIIIENKGNDYEEKILNFKLSNNKLINNLQVLIVNDNESKIVNHKNLENTSDVNSAKKFSKNLSINNKIILEKS